MTTKEFIETYIKPYTWDGTMTYGGGWGPKTEFLDFMDTQQKKGSLLVIEPTSELIDTATNKDVLDLDLDELLGMGQSSVIHRNEHYRFSFPGLHFKVLFAFLLTDWGSETIVLELDSYLQGDALKEKQDIYRLKVIKSSNDKTSLTVYKGSWVPSFIDAIPIQGVSFGRD
jgi:hypothetical protein